MSRYGSAGEVYALIAKRFAGTAYVVLPQVPNGTGHNAGRWLDCVVASLWPSRGLWLHGFEIKVSRSDWLRELQQGEKADAFHKHLDFFSIATAGPVIEAGELPQGWGHADADLVKKRLIERTTATRIPQPNGYDRVFTMGLLRAFDKTVGDADRSEAMRAEYQRGFDCAKKDAASDIAHTREIATKNQVFLEAFHAASEREWFGPTAAEGTRLGQLLKAFREAVPYNTSAKSAAELCAASAELFRHIASLESPEVEKRRA